MSREIPDTKKRGTAGFRKITESFFAGKGLPFDTLLSEEKIVDVFSNRNSLFASNGIYSTSVVLWAFLGQVLRDGKESSCQFAVSCVIDFCLLNNRTAPTQDTGDYCVAREKLSERALRELRAYCLGTHTYPTVARRSFGHNRAATVSLASA
jgi:putative transposase